MKRLYIVIVTAFLFSACRNDGNSTKHDSAMARIGANDAVYKVNCKGVPVNFLIDCDCFITKLKQDSLIYMFCGELCDAFSFYTPDYKYQFFSLDFGYERINMFQSMTNEGECQIKYWQPERGWDSQTNPIGAYQFDYGDRTYYVIKGIRVGSSCEYWITMEIVTFDNGIPTYHTQFFPDDFEMKKVRICNIGEEEKWERVGAAYDVGYWLCSADNKEIEADFSFDPQTLQVDAMTDIWVGDKSNKYGGHHHMSKKTWKLKVKY